MIESNAKKLYLKNLYYNAGQSVADKLYDIFSSCINHHNLSTELSGIAAAPSDINYCIFDCYNAYFNRLCRELTEKVYNGCTVYCITSPYHRNSVVIQLIIPCCNSVFTNICTGSICKANNLYTRNAHQKYSKYLYICRELFVKAEKIQQDLP